MALDQLRDAFDRRRVRHRIAAGAALADRGGEVVVDEAVSHGRITASESPRRVSREYKRVAGGTSVMDYRIPERSAAAFPINEGEAFAVMTPEGRQVADLVAFSRSDPAERFSQSYTRDLNGKVRISTGDNLYTTAGEPILAITADDCGVHDVLFGPCTEWMLTDRSHEGGVQNEPGGCYENLALALDAIGVDERVPDTMNVFQRSTITDQIFFDVRESTAEPGDSVTFEAREDAIVAVAACSAKGVASGSSLSPIDLRLPAGTTVEEATVQNAMVQDGGGSGAA